jgi:hypothetical protein
MNTPVAPHILQRIRAEYLEMPGLALRPEQVQRLCGVESAVCQSVLEALVESRFLSRRPDGAYARYRDPDISRARQAKAGLQPKSAQQAFRPRARASGSPRAAG